MKFGKLAMPQSKEKKMSKGSSDDLDLFGGEDEDEGSPEDAKEDNEELKALSDDELQAECERRGWTVDMGKGAAASNEEMM